MNKIDPDAACVKCGAVNVDQGVRWVAAQGDVPEHLDMKCGACGYTYQCLPLDAAESAPKVATLREVPQVKASNACSYNGCDRTVFGAAVFKSPRLCDAHTPNL
jgi:hypothetical protein